MAIRRTLAQFSDEIVAADIAENAVGASELADDAVDTAAIADGAVDADRIAANAVTEAKLNADVTDGSAIATSVKPHIQPGILCPAYSGKLLDGTTSHSGAYGTAQSDGKSYYYTDIKGSGPIKDPRIGAHFGGQRYRISSMQILEQETATHGKDVLSCDGRKWVRGVWVSGTAALKFYNDANGQRFQLGNGGSHIGYIEITGYFSDVNLLGEVYSTSIPLTTQLDGASAVTKNPFSGTATDPKRGRYLTAYSVANLALGATLGIHTLRINSNSQENQISGFELITQDTTSTTTKSQIQIHAQNVVSYGKKFSLSATAHHYNPFAFAGDGTTAVAIGNTTSHGKVADGWTGSTATYFDSTLDTATSLGLSAWETGGDFYRPVNGGRVVKWVDSSGNIKTSVNMMPPAAIVPFNKRPNDGSNVSLPTETSWTTAYQPVFGGGRTFGNQLLTGTWTHNGSFPFETVGSTTNGTTSASAVLGNGTAWVNTSSYGLLSSPITTVIGRLYKVVLTNVSISGTVKVYYAAAAGDDTYLSGTLVNGQDSTFTIKAEGTSHLISIQAGSGAATITRLDIAVYEIEDLSSQAEVAKTFHWREFGNGAANGGTLATYADATMLGATGDNIAYVMDDGLTSFKMGGAERGTSGANNYVVLGSGEHSLITFIGTGFSIIGRTWGAVNVTDTITQNLPYGSHIAKIHRNGSDMEISIDGVKVYDVATGNHQTHMEYSFHQPKMPPIPEDAVVIADYMLMADFVKQTAKSSHSEISKGVRLVSGSRDVWYNSSAAYNDTSKTNTDIYPFGMDGARAGSAMTAKLHFFGTGVVAGIANSDQSGHAITFPGTTANTKTAVDAADAVSDLFTLANTATLGNNEVISTVLGGGYNFTHYQCAIPIHTSSHYQSFETPFLNELVGGDRNMEQTNLVVTADGKTWDEVTRDTSYIGTEVLNVMATSGNSAGGHLIPNGCRGTKTNRTGHNFWKTDYCTWAYDRMIFLKDGTYRISREIKIIDSYSQCRLFHNGTSQSNIVLQIGPNATGAWQFWHGSVVLKIKRGEYIIVEGYNSGSAPGDGFYIERIEK